jgi:hypothetical protein
MAQNRIFYGVEQIAFKSTAHAQTNRVLELSSSGVAPSGVTAFWEAPRGVQSVGVTTTFDVESVFQLGQLDTYEIVENIPDVEVTVSRVLDGTHSLYLIASDENFDELIPRNETYKTDIAFNIFTDTQSRASGAIVSAIYASGMFLSAGTWTFPVDGNFTEELTFVGNNKFWLAASGACGPQSGSITSGILPSGVFDVDEIADEQGVLTGILRRQDFDLTQSIFPSNIPGVSASGFLTGACAECLQSVTISFDLGREEVFCLGSKDADTRFITFPVEVTTAIEAITRRGDLIESDASIDNLTAESIKIVLSDGMTFDLGNNNKLTSVEFTAGDAGGDNATTTFNFTNNNTLSITSLYYP